MNEVAKIILEQLGGHKFIAMTGSKDFLADNNTLRMTLAKNISNANRLDIKLEPNDTYTMRFYKYSAPKYNNKLKIFINEKVTEIVMHESVYCDNLQYFFTSVTGMDTRLF